MLPVTSTDLYVTEVRWAYIILYYIILYYIILYFIILYGTTVVYAFRRWPKRRYAAHDCIPCAITAQDGRNMWL